MLPFQTVETTLHLRFFTSTCKERNDFIVVVALGNVVECPVAHGLYAVRNIAVGCQQDHLRIGYGRFDFPDHIHPVAVGQFYIA